MWFNPTTLIWTTGHVLSTQPGISHRLCNLGFDSLIHDHRRHKEINEQFSGSQSTVHFHHVTHPSPMRKVTGCIYKSGTCESSSKFHVRVFRILWFEKNVASQVHGNTRFFSELAFAWERATKCSFFVHEFFVWFAVEFFWTFMSPGICWRTKRLFL